MSNRPNNSGADQHSMSGDGEDWANAFDHFLHHELNGHGHHPSAARQMAIRGTGMSPMFSHAPLAGETLAYFPGLPALTLPPTAASHPAPNFGAPRESSSTNDNRHNNTASSGDCDAEDDNLEEDAKEKARSERKRSREKQRRSDVNQQFSELAELLFKIEGSEEDEEEKKKQRLGGSVVSRTASTNRIELIARAIGVLNHLHEKNLERAKEIKELKSQLEEAKQEASKAKSDAAASSAQSKPEGKQDQVCRKKKLRR